MTNKHLWAGSNLIQGKSRKNDDVQRFSVAAVLYFEVLLGICNVVSAQSFVWFTK